MYQIGLCKLFQKFVKIMDFKPLSLGTQEQRHKNNINLDSYSQLYERILIFISWLKRYVTQSFTFLGVSYLVFLLSSFTKLFHLLAFLDSFGNSSPTRPLTLLSKTQNFGFIHLMIYLRFCIIITCWYFRENC